MLDNLAVIEERFEPKVYTLTRNTSAIQLISDLDGNTRLGTILQLPEGAEVRACGDGFNERTVKVSWQGGFYYMFTDDIDRDADFVSRRSERAKGAVWARAAAGLD